MEKFTIVIPTRNNVNTLKHTISTCLRQDYPNFEIIISDNCSNDGTFEMVNSIKDDRIKYIKTPKSLSMTENFEFALSNTSDGFISFIGADDGLMPDAINYVNKIITQYKVKSVCCQYAFYYWPDVPLVEKGKLILNGLGIYKNGVELRNASEWVQKTIDFKTAQYVCELPSLYYGFIHKSVIEKSMKNGKYYHSITPDAYSAFATSLNIDEYAFSYTPFCIAGISGRSNGLSQSLDGEVAQKFLIENAHPIHKDFVFSPAHEVILGEAFFQARDVFPEKCKGLNFNVRLMLKKALLSAGTNNPVSEKVISSAKLMAEMHEINFSDIATSKKDKLYRVLFLMKKSFLDFLSNPRWVVGMRNSTDFNIKNIDEASTALGVMANLNSRKKYEKTFNLLFERVIKRLS